MSVSNPCSFLQGVSTETAQQGRMLVQGLLPTQGIVGGGDLAVAQHGTPNMSVDVAAGACFVNGTASSTQGMYHMFNDATVNLAISAADPTNPRIDIVIAQVQDNTVDSSGVNAWKLAVVTGTPAGSPSAPSLPATSLLLAQVAVAANATSIVTANITDKRVPSQSQGARTICTSATHPSSPRAGQGIYETDTNLEYDFDGTSWRPVANPRIYGVGGADVGGSPPAVSTGKFLVQYGSDVKTTDSGGNATITFPSAFPTGLVTFIAANGDGGTSVDMVITPVTRTASSVALRCWNVNTNAAFGTATVRVNWMAVGW